MMERKAERRRGVSSHFTSPQNDRRRPDYERRNRTAVLPMPPAMVARVLQGDTDTRRFEEAGTE